MRALILGASGQFGRRLCLRLNQHKGLHLLLGGRDRRKLERLHRELAAANPNASVAIMPCDISDPAFPRLLQTQQLDLVIHLAGPFQGQSYGVAQACLQAGIAYIDMADGRDFVAHFAVLDAAARDKNIALITGASTVPGLSSAILDAVSGSFSAIESVDYGICAGLKTGLGLATLQAVLSYCGRPYQTMSGGVSVTRYGLGRPRPHQFSAPLGRRFIVDCDIPDHDLFPARYPSLKQMNFGSCLDAPGLARLLSLMSHCVRQQWIADWNFLSGFIQPVMNGLKPWGSRHSGFFLRLEGRTAEGRPLTRQLEILAREGSGLEIPVTPVVLLVKAMLQGKTFPAGAYPCLGLFSLAEFQQELASYPIDWQWKDLT